ncbi:CO/xanthine dehydrogenase FAD-binding subunit [Mumia flava]|uniref:CO/xanthine dehydrogenase FAD-binding subunit n=1 Tax=Mumia flava TaxID=1348852 RepID=A0A0B2BPK7_9ACTN|nr:FAD binding domain-containing protein [Mumia flava]PJJ58342.1 CO/xanthine dehydrogenase FAD-binding subunit [Mumia flava]
MDLLDVEAHELVTDRGQLSDVRPGDAWLAGGTYLFSEPQPGLRRLRDLTAMDWPALVVDDDGLEIAATCTLGTLAAACGDPAPLLRAGGVRAAGPTALPDGWTLPALARQCLDALLAGFKVWSSATVGGNVCLGLPAGAMTSMLAALDAEVLVWRPDGTSRTTRVPDLVIGDGVTSLGPGELVRSFRVPLPSCTAPVGFRRASRATRGRSGAVLIARRDGDEAVLTVSAAVPRPLVLRLPADADADLVAERVDERVGGAWLDDAYGAADWRRHCARRLGAEVVAEVGAAR